ncbi:MAG: hypothetical protein ACRC62_18135 [Microcoleus sp.]
MTTNQRSYRDARVRIPKKAKLSQVDAAIDLILKERATYWRKRLEESAGRGGTLAVPAEIKEEVWAILNSAQ